MHLFKGAQLEADIDERLYTEEGLRKREAVKLQTKGLRRFTQAELDKYKDLEDPLAKYRIKNENTVENRPLTRAERKLMAIMAKMNINKADLGESSAALPTILQGIDPSTLEVDSEEEFSEPSEEELLKTMKRVREIETGDHCFSIYPLPPIDKGYKKPLPDINFKNLETQIDFLMDSKAEKARLVNEMDIELAFLSKDIYTHKAHFDKLHQLYETLIKQSTTQLIKLKACDAASNKEVNLMGKLKKMVEIVRKSHNPPNPEKIAEALDTFFGENLEKEVERLRASLLQTAQKAQKKSMQAHALLLSDVAEDEGGSVSNLFGSNMNMGSHSNMGSFNFGSKNNLGSNLGLGSFNFGSKNNLGSNLGLGSKNALHGSKNALQGSKNNLGTQASLYSSGSKSNLGSRDISGLNTPLNQSLAKGYTKGSRAVSPKRKVDPKRGSIKVEELMKRMY
jgi:hypothetical protein